MWPEPGRPDSGALLSIPGVLHGDKLKLLSVSLLVWLVHTLRSRGPVAERQEPSLLSPCSTTF